MSYKMDTLTQVFCFLQKKGFAVMNLKEKLIDLFGNIGGTLFIVILLIWAVLPIVVLGMPFYVNAIIIAVVFFVPSSSHLLWIAGLIAIIMGPQDIIAIIYYVLFAIRYIPKIILFLNLCFKKE